jgi:predicted alpha/beta-fold hydrolase
MTATVFKPAWWLPSPHLQTLWPVWFRRRPRLQLQTERVELRDGDFVDLCWSRRAQGRVVLVLHGLEGSLHSHYAAGLMRALERHGFRPVFMYFRGCSGEPNRLPRSYHSGDTGDIAEVVEHIGARMQAPVYAAVGFSLGGNALLKWLGESAEANPLSRAVAVSVPYDLAAAADRMRQGMSRMYQNYLLSSLKRRYKHKFSGMVSPLKIDVDAYNSFHDFDDAVTAPLHGFDGVDHYYRESSSRQYLRHIRVPTRLIHALDDPFMFADTAPGRHELSDSVELLLCSHGGHVGFVAGRFPWKPVYWYEQRIIDYLTE